MGDEYYDLIVLGGGAAGLVGAKLAKGLGKRVVIIEKNRLGGECTWTGCVPSKALIHAASVAHQIHSSAQVGLQLDGDTVQINTDNVFEHVRSIVEKVYSTHTPTHLSTEGIDTIFGQPSFIDSHTIAIENKKLKAHTFLIATGSHPTIPPIEGIDDVSFLTNETLFSMQKVPESLIILGGGPIGIEMASAFHRLGSHVTIVEMNQHIMSHEDYELSQLLRKKMQDEGIVIFSGRRASSIEQKNNSIVVYAKDSDGFEIDICAQHVLVATGRSPNIKGLALEKCGVEYTKKGIVVDEYMRTRAHNIYGAGDVVGSYQFSHVAEKQAQVAVRNALLPFSKKINMRHVGWVTFSSPELARSGLTEAQARDTYTNIRVYSIDYNHIDRGHTDNAFFGRAKIICDSTYHIIGIHILGERAGEILHQLQVAKTYAIPLYKLHEVIHAYPTFSDIIKQLSKQCYIDYLQNRWYIALAKKLFGSKT